MADAPAPPRSARRTLILKALNLAIGGAIGVAMAVPILRFLVFPTRTRTVRGPEGWIPVGKDADVPKDGTPVRVDIVAPEVRDAWTRLTGVAMGGAWLVRGEDGKVKALSTTCPHLGCAVDYDPADRHFECPCHTSAFALTGARISGPARRGMYELATDTDKHGRVLVKPSAVDGKKA